MKRRIIISTSIYRTLKRHLFQNEVEQGAFLFARPEISSHEVQLAVEDYYLVPARAWEVQMDMYLQMRDSERGKIMKMARDKNLAAIDCHSHPHAQEAVWFSRSDIDGITAFSEYVQWKLNGKPFAAIVWGEESCDAVVWHGTFENPEAIDHIQITGEESRILTPNMSWFNPRNQKNRFTTYE